MKTRLMLIALGLIVLTGYTRCGIVDPPENPQIISLDPATGCQRGEWQSISRNRWKHVTTGDIIANRDYQRIPDAEVTLEPGQCFKIPDCAGADPLLLGHFRTTGFNFVDPRPAVFSATGESRSSVIGARFIYLFEPPNGQQESITEFLEDQEPEDALFLCARDQAEPTPPDASWRGWVTIGQTAEDKVANGEGANQGYALFRYDIDIKASDSVCGNSSVEAGEQCDDGNPFDGDGCSSLCQIEEPAAVCGNSILELGEQCDDGVEPPTACEYGQLSCQTCTAQCTRRSGDTTYCGDGYIDTQHEQCDDGNTINGDGCDSQCVSEIVPSVCGNGVVEGLEQCDDGNTVTEDCAYGVTGCTVCSDACFEIEGATRVCGDGVVNAPFEQCDDGNTIDGDGCSSACLVPVTASIEITQATLTPDVSFGGQLWPRLTADINVAAVVSTNEALTELTATVINCDPTLVSNCAPVTGLPSAFVEQWSVELPDFTPAVEGRDYSVELSVVDASGRDGMLSSQAPFTVFPPIEGLALQCTKQHDTATGDLTLGFTVIDTGLLPINPATSAQYTLSDIWDARYWLYQRSDASGWALDETDSVRTSFVLINPVEFRAVDDGEYQLIFGGLLGFTEEIQMQTSIRIDTLGGIRDICTSLD